MARPTASSLWLGELCPASHVLPQVRETNEGQAFGTAIHKYAELAPQIGKERALAAIPEEMRERCGELDPTSLPAGNREVPIEYDLEHGEARLLDVTDRAYPKREGCVYGTIDVLQIQRQSVWDYKSGWPGSANESLQLAALGLFAARALRWDEVTVGHLRIDGERLRLDFHLLSGIELAAVHARIKSILARYEGAKSQEIPDVYPGDHCTMCPAMPACPATTAMIRQVSEAMAEESRVAAMVEADPVGAWTFLERAGDALDRLRAELKRRASMAPIDLGNGKQLRILDVEKKTIDGKRGLPILRDTIPDVDALCSVSKTRLEKALGKRNANVVMQRLEAAGAVETNTEHHLRKVAAKEP